MRCFLFFFFLYWKIFSWMVMDFYLIWNRLFFITTTHDENKLLSNYITFLTFSCQMFSQNAILLFFFCYFFMFFLLTDFHISTIERTLHHIMDFIVNLQAFQLRWMWWLYSFSPSTYMGVCHSSLLVRYVFLVC